MTNLFKTPGPTSGDHLMKMRNLAYGTSLLSCGLIAGMLLVLACPESDKDIQKAKERITCLEHVVDNQQGRIAFLRGGALPETCPAGYASGWKAEAVLALRKSNQRHDEAEKKRQDDQRRLSRIRQRDMIKPGAILWVRFVDGEGGDARIVHDAVEIMALTTSGHVEYRIEDGGWKADRWKTVEDFLDKYNIVSLVE